MPMIRDSRTARDDWPVVFNATSARLSSENAAVSSRVLKLAALENNE